MTQRRSIGRIGVITIVVALMLPLVTAEARASSTWYIDVNTTLTEDYAGSIVISANNITLDCGGWTVSGTNASDGIVIEGHSGVSVRNCVVQQFVYGIVVKNSSNVLLEHNEVRWNGLSGVDVCCGSVNVVVRQNTMHENGFDAGYSGIDVEFGSSGVTVSDNTSWGNAGSGFYIFQSNNLVFDNNDAFSNSLGFNLDGETTDSTFSNNRVWSNAGDGVRSVASDTNRFIANDVRGNGGAGILLHRSSRNALRSNNVRENGAEGIWVDTESYRNVIRGNDVEWNNSTGIPVTDGSDWNLLEGNVTSHNGDAGIRVETSHNTFLSNRADDNATYGFWVIGSYNKLAFNSGCGNGILDGLEEADAKGNVWLANNLCTSDL